MLTDFLNKAYYTFLNKMPTFSLRLTAKFVFYATTLIWLLLRGSYNALFFQELDQNAFKFEVFSNRAFCC